jgi:predicted dehydrogenase
MSTRPLGVGVVGCGLIGARRAAVAASNGRSRVVAVTDRDRSRAEEVAAATGGTAVAQWEAVVDYPGVDIVVVATTHDWLAPISIGALQAGKHVLCEKPMSRSSREAEGIVAAAHSSGRYVHVGFNHRYHPAIRRAHDLARAGEVGDLLFIRCRYGHGGRVGYEREWRMDPELSGGGELLDQGMHAIDLFRWFLGELTEVTGMTAAWVWKAPVEDNVFALFRSPRGQVASLHASWTQWKNVFSFEVFGTLGGLVVEGLGKSYGTERLTIYRRADSGPPQEERLEFPGPDHSWEDEWEEFLAAIRDGQPPPIDGEEGLAALRIAEAVYAAARSGATIRVESLRDKEGLR